MGQFIIKVVQAVAVVGLAVLIHESSKGHENISAGGAILGSIIYVALATGIIYALAGWVSRKIAGRRAARHSGSPVPAPVDRMARGVPG